jgi:hypothetical protein
MASTVAGKRHERFRLSLIALHRPFILRCKPDNRTYDRPQAPLR